MYVITNCLAQIDSIPLLQSFVMLRFHQREDDISGMQPSWHAASHEQHANGNMQQLKGKLFQLLDKLEAIAEHASPTNT